MIKIRAIRQIIVMDRVEEKQIENPLLKSFASTKYAVAAAMKNITMLNQSADVPKTPVYV